MGKYGSIISMKAYIELYREEVRRILAKSNLSEEDKKAVMDAFTEMAFQWCQSNASACAMEEAVIKMFPDLDMAKLFHEIISSGVREQKMKDTFPDEEETEDEN